MWVVCVSVLGEIPKIGWVRREVNNKNTPLALLLLLFCSALLS